MLWRRHRSIKKKSFQTTALFLIFKLYIYIGRIISSAYQHTHSLLSVTLSFIFTFCPQESLNPPLSLSRLLRENKNILKWLQIWRIHLKHFLLSDSIWDMVDVAYGLQTKSKLSLSSSSSSSFVPFEKCHLSFKVSEWWLHIQNSVLF